MSTSPHRCFALIILVFLMAGFSFGQSSTGSAPTAGTTSTASSSAKTNPGTNLAVSATAVPSTTNSDYKIDSSESAQPSIEPMVPADLSIIENMIISAVPETQTILRQYGYSFFNRKYDESLAIVGDDYIVGPGDIMLMYIWGDAVDIKELPGTVELIVDREGSINLPSIGRITVWGQQLSQIKTQIKSALDKKFKRIDLSLTLGKLREFPVSVAGFVNMPGTIMATAVDTVFDIISRAGGALATGSLRKITLTRRNSAPVVIDLYDILIKGQPSDLRVREGDAILIPGIGKVAAISGAVRRPAIYELSSSETVTELINYAGGILPSALSSHASLVRFTNNTRTIQDGSLLDRSFIGQSLLDGDVLVISAVSDLLERVVYLDGWTMFPGRYEITDNFDLRTLLNKSVVLKDTNLWFGTVYRLSDGGRPASFTFRPKEVMAASAPSIPLLAQDIITLYQAGQLPENFDYQTFPDTVSLSGTLRYPLIASTIPNTRLSELISLELLLPETNLDFAVIDRQTAGGLRPNLVFEPREVLNGRFDLKLEPLDKVRFFTAGLIPEDLSLTEYPETVTLSGAVRYPNAYHYRTGLKLSGLLKFEQLRSDTSLFYGRIIRSEAGGVQRVLPFIPRDILAGVYDIELKMKDDIQLYTLSETSRSLKLAPDPAALPSTVLPPAVSPAAVKLPVITDSQATDTSLSTAVTAKTDSPDAIVKTDQKDSEALTPAEPQETRTAADNLEETKSLARPSASKPSLETLPTSEALLPEKTPPSETLSSTEAELLASYRAAMEKGELLVVGEVAYSGLYGHRPGLSLSHIIDEAFLLADTNLDFAVIDRRAASGLRPNLVFAPREVLNGSFDLLLESLDIIRFFKAGSIPEGLSLNEYPETVILSGAVRYPNAYHLRPGLKLSELLKPDQLQTDTSLYYGRITRSEAGGVERILAFIPSEILSGVYDIELKMKDQIQLFSLAETSRSLIIRQEFGQAEAGITATKLDKTSSESALIEGYRAALELSEILVMGEVKYSGLYGYRTGLKLSDILKADKLLPSTNLDFAVIDRHAASGRRPNLVFTPREVLDGRFDTLLEPLDFIRFFKAGVIPADLSLNEYPETVTLHGAVRYPNAYHHRPGLKLSDLFVEEQLKNDTSLFYGRITRSESGGIKRFIPFIPRDILAGVYDIDLKIKDDIQLFTLAETSRSLKALDQFTWEADDTAIEGSPSQATENLGPVEAEGLLSDPTTDLSPVTVTTAPSEALPTDQAGGDSGYGEFLMVGELKYSGLYGHRPGLKLSEVLEADQLLPTTNQYYGQIVGVNSDGRPRYQTFSPIAVIEGREDLIIYPLDIVRLFRFGEESTYHDIDKFPQAVTIAGTILHKGIYSWQSGMMLSSILTADSLLLDTDRDYATILRINEAGQETLLHFSPQRLFEAATDIELLPRDRIVFNRKTVYEPIQVAGEVKQATVVSFYPDIRLEEALKSVELLADVRNLKVHIQRLTGEHLSLYLEDIFIKQKAAPPLQAGDKITVLRLLPTEAEKIIIIRGEVAMPQALSFQEGMRLSAALDQAGGLTKAAYLKGLVLQRPSVAEAQKAHIDRLINSISAARQAVASDQSTALAASTADDSASITAINASIQLAAQQAELSRLRELYSTSLGRVALDMPNDLNSLKGSAADIVLERDDMIYIPRQPSFVTILGESMNQLSLAWEPKMTARTALENAGWVSEDSDLAAAYIVRANGRVKSGEGWNFWFFRPSILNLVLEPGDTIYIPRKPYRLNTTLPIIRDVMQIIGQILSAAVTTVALTRTF